MDVSTDIIILYYKEELINFYYVIKEGYNVWIR